MIQSHLNSARSWLVVCAGIFTYMAAVSQRTSFGVAGLQATERFDATAQILASFSVVQLVVYAGAQVPVGLLLDKVGPRIMIITGSVLMAMGQAFLAISTSVPMGLGGRILVGSGDAMVFVSVLKLLPLWFSGSRIPVLTQLVGTFGQAGQLVSLFPFHLILVQFGWTPAFSIMSGLALASLLIAISLIRNGPGWAHLSESAPMRTRDRLTTAWKQPGTRLGFWTHFTTSFMLNVFLLTWGYPFLVQGQGLEGGFASGLMSIFVAVAVLYGPLLGALTARYPQKRSNFALGVIGAMVFMWAVVLFWPGAAPLWVLIILLVAVAAGGPSSVIAFDFARTFNPPNIMGTAIGLVNTGGFFGGFVTIYLVGVVMDWLYVANGSVGELYNLPAFRIALSVQFVMAAIGVTFMLIERRKARRQPANIL
ncbi:MFS transporter [Arthrobacter sp. MYb211]|uniref:MFS transporter n=1 Tax=Micrococcaceae TaxID=1268 RepID=UPI000CFA868C|nr:MULTISPECIES: MFS transporter [unclassified Arthrobacter]PRA06359.1 MFS transporter [Arthrobacter sp. MYb229]PRB53261.1 MFS transporter [Arthrobacter sp. MYb216]PRC09775.1 MFS transporter [Arthrobacter sp. MYb211]PRA01449.1 MFS transporter [Arthrobacter sp. MYb224]PRA12704.1 MFS transporter [Arthrobacter sp. MYb221]